MEAKDVEAMASAAMSQVGDDVREHYDRDVLFKRLVATLRALLARAEAAERERDALAAQVARLREALERAADHIHTLHRGLHKAKWGKGAKPAAFEINEADRAFAENESLWADLRQIALAALE